MELIVRPTNINRLNQYINMGATAFIFGVKGLSINATSLVNLKVIMYLKQKYPNVKIYLSINKNIQNNDLKKLKKTLFELEKIKVDGVLFYDLAVLNIVKSNNLNIPLIINQDFLITNYLTCNYYDKELCSGAVLSNEITIEEILEVRNKTNINTYVNAFGYQMMTFSKRKLISNYFKKYKMLFKDRKSAIIKEKNKDESFIMVEDNEGTFILTSCVFSNMKYMDKIIDNNFSGIILNEAFLNHKKFLQVLNIYNLVMNNKKNHNEALEEIDSLFKTNTYFLDKKTIYKVKKI